MLSGQNSGDSAPALTVDSASTAIESLLFPEEDKQTTEATPETADAEKETPETEETAPAEEPEVESDPDEESESEPDEAESEDEEDVSDQPPEPRKIKIRENGQEYEVTEDEAAAGYSRTQDYTRKTQKLSEERRAFEAERASVLAERQQNLAKLTETESLLQELVKEPDWDKLLAEDPGSFALVHATWQRHKSRLDGLAAERQRIETQMQRDAEAAYTAHLEGEGQKLLERIPEWKDQTTAKKDRASLVEYAQSQGFTSDELNGISDHRALVLLRKAMLYDKSLQDKQQAAQKSKPKIDKVKAAKPGPADSSKRQVSELTRQKQRLAKTHSVNDAASLIELMMGG